MQPFVGRNVQLRELEEHLAAGLTGRASVCLVTGEPGAGKSTLINEFCRRAREAHPQLLIATGVCDAYTGLGDPYLPFREILGELTGHKDAAAGENTAPGEPAGRTSSVLRFAADAIAAHGPDLVDIFLPGGAIVTRLGWRVAQRTEWGRRRAEAAARGSQTTPAAPAVTQENIFEQYTQVIVALAAQRPLLLIIDDLHWADSGSVGLLFHLARRLARAPVLIVGAYRRAEVHAAREGSGQALAGVIVELQRIFGEIEVRLDDLGAREFVDALTDQQGATLGADFREALTRHSSGNPLFAVELLRSLEDSGALQRDASGQLRQVATPRWESLPSRVIGVIESRIRRLGPEQRNLLAAASVQGETFTADVLAEVVGGDRRSIIRELSGPLQKEHELVAAIGLQEAGGRSLAAYRFRHNLVQDYLYRALDEIEASEFHRETGLALERLLADDASAAVRIGSHFIRAGQWDKAVVYSVRAGENAVRQLAPIEAIRHLELALELRDTRSPRLSNDQIDVATVTETLADQLLVVGRFDDATMRYRQSLACADVAAVITRARLLRRLALVPERQTRYPEALQLLDEAMIALGVGDSEPTAAWQEQWIDIQLARCGIHYWCNDIDAMQACQDSLRPVIGQWGNELQRGVFHAEVARRGLRLSRYRPDAATREAARAAAASVKSRAMGPAEAECIFLHAFTEMWAGEFLVAAETLAGLLESVRRSGDVTQQLRSLTYLALVHRRLDQPQQVADLNEKGRDLAGMAGQEAYAAMMLAQDAWVAWRTGARDTARALNDRALQTWSERAPRYPFQFPALWLAAAMALEEGDARRAAELALRTLSPTQIRPPDAVEEQLDRLRAVAADDEARCSTEMHDAVALAQRLHFI